MRFAVEAQLVVHEVLYDAIGAALVFARFENRRHRFGVAYWANGVVRRQGGLGHERLVAIEEVDQAVDGEDLLGGHVRGVCAGDTSVYIYSCVIYDSSNMVLTVLQIELDDWLVGFLESTAHHAHLVCQRINVDTRLRIKVTL